MIVRGENMNYQLPEEVKAILERFTKAGFEIYIVGGAVRDLILGRAVPDWDFTTNAKPEEILHVLPEGFYNNQFGTVGVQSSVLRDQSSENSIVSEDRRLTTDDSIFEITTMREEHEYKDFRHPENVQWTDDIRKDLARRDFTINAIALGPSTTQDLTLIDPFGGQHDIEIRTIRAVGDPVRRFQEDALRLMRAIRFTIQLDFTTEQQTYKAIQENAHLIQQISWERIRDELLKILATDRAYEGILLLKESGLLTFILPEIEATFGIVQEGPKHERIYDIGEHLLLSLKNTPSQDPIVKLAVLLHDIGKPATYKRAENGNVTFYQHEIVGANMAKKIAERLHLSRKEIDTIYKLVRFHMFTVDEHQTDSAVRRFIRNIGVENIDNMMALRIGDRIGGGTQRATSWRMENFIERIDQVMQKPFSVSDLKVTGNDVMEVLQVKPSRKVGEVLNKLFEEVSEDQTKNNREYLLEKIKSFR